MERSSGVFLFENIKCIDFIFYNIRVIVCVSKKKYMYLVTYLSCNMDYHVDDHVRHTNNIKAACSCMQRTHNLR